MMFQKWKIRMWKAQLEAMHNIVVSGGSRQWASEWIWKYTISGLPRRILKFAQQYSKCDFWHDYAAIHRPHNTHAYPLIFFSMFVKSEYSSICSTRTSRFLDTKSEQSIEYVSLAFIQRVDIFALSLFKIFLAWRLCSERQSLQCNDDGGGLWQKSIF